VVSLPPNLLSFREQVFSAFHSTEATRKLGRVLPLCDAEPRKDKEESVLETWSDEEAASGEAKPRKPSAERLSREGGNPPSFLCLPSRYLRPSILLYIQFHVYNDQKYSLCESDKRSMAMAQKDVVVFVQPG